MNFKELMEFDKQIVEKYMDELLSINVIYEKKLMMVMLLEHFIIMMK